MLLRTLDIWGNLSPILLLFLRVTERAGACASRGEGQLRSEWGPVRVDRWLLASANLLDVPSLCPLTWPGPAPAFLGC